MPATTIVLEWSSADTGVGPSIADGSHGCNPNCADLPVAASRRPIRGSESDLSYVMNNCCSSHELEWLINHAMEITNPMSPIRLYKTACKAAVFASVRPYHHPINRKDIMPTPSHPIKSWNRLLAVTRIIIVIRNVSKYLKNLSM